MNIVVYHQQDSSQAMEVASAMETALQSLDGIQCETLISSLKVSYLSIWHATSTYYYAV